MRKSFDGFNIFIIIVEWLVQAGARFAHYSLLSLYLVIYLFICLFTWLLFVSLFVLFFLLAVINHLILRILYTICHKRNWNKSLIIIIMSQDFASAISYVLQFVGILKTLILRNSLQLASTSCQDSLIKLTQRASLLLKVALL